MEALERCGTCDKPKVLCVCDRITPQACRTRLLILQHPQEQDRDLGTVSLVRGTLPTTVVRIGLSWPSLAQCLEEEVAHPDRWVTLYPSSLARALTEPELATPCLFLDRKGDVRDPALPIEGVIALDGSWSQAKTLWWRNPWLLKHGRAVLHPTEPSIYGRLRREPRREAVSTLEAVGEALVAAGEPPELRDALRKVFRTMVQRARDAGTFAPPPPVDRRLGAPKRAAKQG